MDAAVAIEAIDPSSSSSVMILSTWTNYASRLYASQWYQLFSPANGYANDARYTLSWNNRLGNLQNVSVYNFFSSGEEVLRTDPDDPPNYPGAIYAQELQNYGNGLPFGTYAWYWQEKDKGVCGEDSLMGSSHGGWLFTSSTNYEVPTNIVVYIDGQYVTNTGYTLFTPAQAAGIPNAALRTNTFFSFRSTATNFFPDVALPDPNQGSAYAAANRNRILSDAIPAMSLVIGANQTSILGSTHNINMMTLENAWPQDRMSTLENTNWHHSDYHEVAYTFTHKLFDQYVTSGNLK
jgi:hypothetical protein